MTSDAALRSILRTCLALALTVLWAGCLVPTATGIDEPGDVDADGDAVLENVTGTVTKVGNFGFGLVPDSDPGTRYAPTEPLDDEFQQDGLRVRFSGIVGDPDESAAPGGRGGRRWGTPFEVTHIEALDPNVWDDSDEQRSGGL